MARLWDNSISVPTHNELNKLADQVSDGYMIQTKRFGDVWCCYCCGKPQQPEVNFLATLPAYQCDGCNVKQPSITHEFIFQNPTTYEWKITETAIEGISLDFMVYDQGNTNHCSLYACLGALDFARKIEPAMHTVIEATPFDVGRCLENFKAHAKGCELEKLPTYMSNNGELVSIVLTVFKHYGVPYDLGTRLDTSVAHGEADFVKIQGHFNVPILDVHLVTRLIASGFPLVATVNIGRLFQFVGSRDVYSAAPTGDCTGSHAVVLIGCGVAMRNGQVETYYFVRNSHGPKRHPNHNSQDYGGDFCVWASDVRSLWGFKLADW